MALVDVQGVRGILDRIETEGYFRPSELDIQTSTNAKHPI